MITKAQKELWLNALNSKDYRYGTGNLVSIDSFDPDDPPQVCGLGVFLLVSGYDIIKDLEVRKDGYKTLGTLGLSDTEINGGWHANNDNNYRYRGGKVYPETMIDYVKGLKTSD